MIHKQKLACPKLIEIFTAVQFELLYLILDKRSKQVYFHNQVVSSTMHQSSSAEAFNTH